MSARTNNEKITSTQASGFHKKEEAGAVLIFCLVFLLILTMMGVSSMESTILEERMAGNMQDHGRAFQAAEAALQAGEEWLAGELFWPATSNDGSTPAWLRDTLDPVAGNSVPWWNEPGRNNNTWWRDNAISLNGFGSLAENPGYIIEEYFTATEGESIAIGTGTQNRVQVFHRVTARGIGENESTVVQLQSTFVKTYE
ncbi:MAG: PilX N-terminal domain-containing pilus assembly protein [Pseudomonadales bacterium]|nr:PilX N-terminal domain-containing pilus assembly protein [Pseudomonadales bacterium]